MTRPSRTPRRPSIGFCSCSRCTAASSRVRPWRRRSPRSSASATSTDSSVRSGRNSCSGGSSSRIVTGSPSIASRISTKSSRCSGSSSSSAASRSSSSSARISVLDQLAPVAEEHVLGAAQPDALRRRTGGPGRRPRRCRRWPAPAAGGARRRAPSAGATAATSSSPSRGRSSPSKYWTTGESTDRHLAEEDLAGGAVDRDRRRPRATVAPSGRGEPPGAWRRRRAPRRRRRRCCPCRGRRRRRARSCRRGW